MPAKLNLVGRRYGRLLVQKEGEKRGRSKVHWLCFCDCGVETEVSGSNLQTRMTESCGCGQALPEDMTGRVYGSWTVLSIAPKKRKGDYGWFCTCFCGTFRVVSGNSLRLGRSTSCGCTHTTHGMRHTPTWHIWSGLLQRVLNPKCESYKNYGGRGITVDPKWLKFEGFFHDMGERPEGLCIERVDNNAGYCKENCIWTTNMVQSRNKRSNVYVSYNGIKTVLKDAAALANMNYTYLHLKLFKKNLSVSEAFKSENFKEWVEPLSYPR
jgi:hypothetical protein